MCFLQDAATGDAAFDMAHNTRLRGGHAGPVTRLSLTDRLLCSSSLDFTARLWQRGSKMRCISVLHLGDWVWDVVARCARHRSLGSCWLLLQATALEARFGGLVMSCLQAIWLCVQGRACVGGRGTEHPRAQCHHNRRSPQLQRGTRRGYASSLESGGHARRPSRLCGCLPSCLFVYDCSWTMKFTAFTKSFNKPTAQLWYVHLIDTLCA